MATFSPKAPEARIARLREAKAAGFYADKRLDGSKLDPMSADLIVTIYDGLSAENRARFIAMPYPKMHRIAMQLLDKGAVRYSVGGARTKSRTARRAGRR